MKFNRLSLMLFATLCLTMPSAINTSAFAETSKSHWALSSLEEMQIQKLFLNLKTDSKSLDAPINAKQFQLLLSELWLSQTITLPLENEVTETTAILTRQGAAEKVHQAFLPFLDDKKTDSVTWIKSTGIMKGFPNGEFKEADKVTLAQGVVIMKQIKNYLKDQPDLAYKISHSNSILQPEKQSVSYSVQANASGTIDFVLSWGEKKTGGYSITITDSKVVGTELQISYRTVSPGPDSMVTQALTYPKATKTLDMSLETYKTLKVVLIEEK